MHDKSDEKGRNACEKKGQPGSQPSYSILSLCRYAAEEQKVFLDGFIKDRQAADREAVTYE
jgi:hypothetical protein